MGGRRQRMHVGVIGLNHKLAELNLREKLAKICQRRFGADQSAHANHAFVLLSTCNRTEIYFCSHNLTETHTYILNILRNDIECDFDQKLYSYFHEDCFLHLARVTCGLDSAIVFETEIQGQVKIAYEKACDYISLPCNMHFLFQKCLRIGKKIRTQVPLDRGTPNLEHAILSTGKELFPTINNKKVLFVGASDINLKILHFLKNKNVSDITLCNRTNETTDALAEKYQLEKLLWKDICQWHRYDWIIFGTKSPEYLITQDDFDSTSRSPKLIIDLCVPRNVDPKVARIPSIKLLNIDQINRTLKMRKKQVTNFVIDAETLIEKYSHRQINIFKGKSSAKDLHLPSIKLQA